MAQEKQLLKDTPPDILICTPGRLSEHFLGRGTEKCREAGIVSPIEVRGNESLLLLKREFCHVVSMFGPGGHALCFNKCTPFCCKQTAPFNRSA